MGNDLAELRHKYVSLEGTHWGELLDFLTNELKLTWLNKSWHWELLFQALAYKSKLSSLENPIIVLISIPVFGAFAYQEMRQFINSVKEKFIDVYWYGKEVCEQEKMDRIANYCISFNTISKIRKCKKEVYSIDCKITCLEYMKGVLDLHKAEHYIDSEDKMHTATNTFITCHAHNSIAAVEEKASSD